MRELPGRKRLVAPKSGRDGAPVRPFFGRDRLLPVRERFSGYF